MNDNLLDMVKGLFAETEAYRIVCRQKNDWFKAKAGLYKGVLIPSGVYK